MKHIKLLLLLLASALSGYAQPFTNFVTTNIVTYTTNAVIVPPAITNVIAPGTGITITTNHAADVIELQVPMVLSSLRFILGNETVMGADIAADKLLLDVPGSARKMFSYKLDATLWYVVETRVTITGGILQTKRFQPETGITDLSPNLLRNQFTGEYDSYKVFLVPTPLVPPRIPGEVTTP